MELHEFLSLVELNYVRTRSVMRYGQVLFNTLSSENQVLADKITGTEFDPFYAEKKDDERCTNCIRFLMDNWS